ncbi:hypothetical protein MJ524_13145 [Escherichia coli]|nr:hypothetical protein MJ524_13145 [Escherichia coli]
MPCTKRLSHYSDHSARWCRCYKEAADELTPGALHFHIQLLLIHFYRRVVLKDPLLPEELLSAHWAGHTARQPVLYQHLSARERRCC